MIRRASKVAVLVALASCSKQPASISPYEAGASELIVSLCANFADKTDPNKERWSQLADKANVKSKTLPREAYELVISAQVDAIEQVGSGRKYPTDTPETYMKRELTIERCRTNEHTLLRFLEQSDEKRPRS